MRYTEIDLQIEDIMWFAIDNFGRVGAFISGGSANVPEFVCEDREANEKLYEYFTEILEDYCSGKLLNVKHHSEQEKECMALISKGITCFDVYKNVDDYCKIAEPFEVKTIDKLNDEIKDILKSHKIDADFVQDTIIKVEHAYK